MGWIPVVLMALFVLSLMQGAWVRRRALDLRMQILELLELATRRGLPMEPILRKGALGQGRHARRTFTVLARDLERGEYLSEALADAAPDSFPPRASAAIAAAEGSAQLDAVLTSLLEQSDESIALHHRMAMALLYPLILGLGVVFAQEFVIGSYASGVFGNPTAGWFSISNWVSGMGIRGLSPWTVFASGVILTLFVLHRSWRSSPSIRRAVVRSLGALPWLSKSARYLAASRFLATLSPMIAAGQALPAAMRRAMAAVGNRRMEQGILAASTALEEGHAPGDAWRLAGLPEFALASVMAASNAETGQFACALGNTAVACRERFVTARERIMDLLHPAGVILFGLLLALDFAVLMSITTYCREATELW